MCDAAPGIIFLLDRMGVPFNRTPEGLLDFRRFGGTHHRTAFAGATTGQQLLYALDEQVRRYEVGGPASASSKDWELLSARARRGGRSAAASSRRTTARMELRAFPGDAVDARDRRPGHHLRPLDQLAHQHRHRPRARPTSRARATRTASSSRCTRRRSRARTSCASSRSRCAARAGASGPIATASRGTSSRRCTRPTATSCRATSRRRAIFKVVYEKGLGVDGADRGLPRRHATSIPTMLDAQARGRARDLREVRRRRTRAKCR